MLARVYSRLGRVVYVAIVFTIFCKMSSLIINECNSEQIQVSKIPYVEYRPGSAPIILSAPHGGSLTPSSIPDRTNGCLNDNGNCEYIKDPSCASSQCKVTTVTDSYTIEVAEIIAETVEEIVGRKPYIVLCNLKRTKLDANRDVEEAAQGNSEAIEAWNEYHAFIRQAQQEIQRGIVFDLHGQAHMQNSTEVGYLILKSALNNESYDESISSIRALASRTGMSGRELMVGEKSFGAFLENEGFNALPSPRQPYPGDDSYYRGGYITQTHGSRDGGEVDAIQLEMPKEVRIDGGEEVRIKFAKAVGRAIAAFCMEYYA